MNAYWTPYGVRPLHDEGIQQAKRKDDDQIAIGYWSNRRSNPYEEQSIAQCGKNHRPRDAQERNVSFEKQPTNQQFIAHLASAGCESVWIGAESGSQNILDAMEKGTTVEQIYESRKLLKKHNVKTCFFLQFGYSGETAAEIKKTIRMVRELMPDDIGISVSYPLPGTKFYERVSSQMGEKKNWVDSGDFEMMFDGQYDTNFYRVLHKRVHKEFRSRQILNEPLKRLRSVWKLPYYLAGWMWYAVVLSVIGRSVRTPACADASAGRPSGQ